MLQKLITKLPIHSRWRLAFLTLPLVAVIVLAKLAVHLLAWEFLTLNSLFTAIISANIFLIGFLISGVLVDYKESEKIPSEMATSVEILFDEGAIIRRSKGSPESLEYLEYLRKLNQSLLDWFCKKERTSEVMAKLSGLNRFFLAFESQTQANFIARLKQEQGQIRRLVNRAHVIRETSFLGTGYAIAEIITVVLVIGLIFIKMEPFYESIFFVSFVSFILVYMINFIKDLDNPFGYSQEDSLVEEVSLKPLTDSLRSIERRLSKPDEFV